MDMLPDFMFAQWMGKAVWLWLAFLAIVVGLLAFDLGVVHRKSRAISVRESMVMCAFYVVLSMLFSVLIYWIYKNQPAIENLDHRMLNPDAAARAGLAAQLYLTGYLVELSLSMDNVFVISLIFGYFAIPVQYQHRVLFWGILGVIILRAAMILPGAVLVSRFGWVLYIFGGFLVFTGLKMLFMEDKEHDIGENPLLKYLRTHFPVTNDLHGERFFVKPAGGRAVSMTPLFLALVLIGVADVIFAVDSVPAIFAITKDPYIVYTSNIFAILGLWSLYFTLAAMVDRFAYLKYALALVLIFIGGKIFYTEMTHKSFPAWISLAVTVVLLAGGIAWSLWKTRRPPGPAA
ncbi:MAG: TerC/Alx family metal homeostasis membrane protein [Alphaproteobacteria bacterium]|nr:TerC/Alx family metal homeostasis membrane protein [Alphaproteobacteria bacterium]